METLSLTQFGTHCSSHNAKSFIIEIINQEPHLENTWLAVRFDRLIVDEPKSTIELFSDKALLRLSFVEQIEIDSVVEGYYQKFYVMCISPDGKEPNKYELMMTF